MTACERRWHVYPFVKSHGVRAAVNVNVIEKIYIFFKNAAFSGVGAQKNGRRVGVPESGWLFQCAADFCDVSP